MPSVGDRVQALFVPPPHPALLSAEDLFAECDHRFQRRSGPGGQHRNKTSSGVFLFHQPTGVTAEATERRSQADNRAEALMRLRMKMATDVRTVSILDLGDKGDFGDERVVDPIERDVRTRYHSRSLRFRDTNPDRPSVLALVINDLHAAGGQPSLVAKVWSTSTTAIVSLLKSHSPALGWINAVRFHHGRGPLK
jgi:hypothetical protein